MESHLKDEGAILSKLLGDPSAMQKEWENANRVSASKPNNFGVKIKSILHDVLGQPRARHGPRTGSVPAR